MRRGGSESGALAGSPGTSRKASGSPSTGGGSGAGRFEFATDRSPLQKLELELKTISNEEEEEEEEGTNASPTVRRTLSKQQKERLHRSTTVTSRITGVKSPRFDDARTESAIGSFQSTSIDQQSSQTSMGHSTNRQNHGKASETTMSGSKEAVSKGGNRDASPSGRSRKKRGFFNRRRKSSSSESSVKNTIKAATTAVAQVARLTLEDGEFEDDPTDELLDQDPIPKYNVPESDEGMPFTITEVLNSGLIILPSSPDTPFFHMVRDPLLQQPGIAHPYHSNNASYPRPRRLSAATAASFSSPDISLPPVESNNQKKEEHPSQSTGSLMLYMDSVSPRPVPKPSIFTPKLYVKCGPMLRYVGLRCDGMNPRDARRGSTATAKEQREVWRGTVLIVTSDDQSTYDPRPTLRLYVQSIDAFVESGGDAFQNGNDTTGTKTRRGSTASHWYKKDGEKRRQFKQIEALKLHADRGVTWWRFSIEVELNDAVRLIVFF